ncbi:hypothetical protein R3P38DRAFT_3004594 [Favolaschia claudopus]|uniref:HNH nuclease domain-containing protein n=1 Tax=Favolaschia claudopus TaxID=2862362 RepID=A0AAW0ALV0_9AGAR
MSEIEELPRPSQRSIEQQRNFHLFSFSNWPLILIAGGWNLSRHNISVKTFYRWLDITEADNADYCDNKPELRKINIKSVGLVRYGLKSVCGPSLSRDSMEILEPGLYGPYLDSGDKPFGYQLGTDNPAHSFAYVERGLEREKNKKLLEHCKMSSAVVEAVRARDQGVCFVTGRTGIPTTEVWIFLPVLAIVLHPIETPKKDFEAFRVEANVITLGEDLVQPFKENMFSVDIHDRSRIITFVDIPNAPALPSHLPFPPDGSSLEFWGLSFKRTLGIYFHGGDIAHDRYEPGCSPEQLMSDVADWGYNSEDDVWKTVAGAAELAELERREALEDSDSDSDDDEDVDGNEKL